MLASWSTGRWDLTLEGGRWVHQESGMTLGGRRVHRTLYESGARYASREGKSGLRRAAAGFWVGAAQTSRNAVILRLWVIITGIGGKHASAARIVMGVDLKQLETHHWTVSLRSFFLFFFIFYIMYSLFRYKNSHAALAMA